MIAKLIPIDGSPPIEIVRDVTVIGRKRGSADVFVDHSSVSKLHCVIAKTDGLLFFRDLGSTNGTKVNGQRVTRGALLPGDELAFASVKFRVHLGPGEPAVTPEDRTECLIALPQPPDEDSEPEFPVSDHSDSDVQLLPSDSNLDAVAV